MASTRDQIIETTCNLLESQGFHGTGLNQIIKESGAPRGSLYYYFPDGKDELAEAAIAAAGKSVAERIRAELSEVGDAVEAVQRFVANIAHFVEASDYRNGGPLTTVAMETATTNERLNQACRAAYTLIQGAFRDALVASGYPEVQAMTLATFVTAAIEGGTILCRTYHSGDPLRTVADQLKLVLEAARPDAAPIEDQETS